MSHGEDLPSEIAVDRALGLRGSFHDFVQMAWPLVEHARPFVDNWHIRAICEHLEAVFDGRIKRLVINIPPGCMKSLTCSVFWPVWCWLRNPSWRFIYGSFDKDLVGKRDGSKVLEIIQSKWFQERFGDKVLIRGKDPAFGDFETTQRGFRWGGSGWPAKPPIYAPITAFHGHSSIRELPSRDGQRRRSREVQECERSFHPRRCDHEDRG